MTLREWCDKHGYYPTHPTAECGAVSFCAELCNGGDVQWELYHLSDYAVSTVSGMVYWLVPRQVPCPRGWASVDGGVEGQP